MAANLNMATPVTHDAIDVMRGIEESLADSQCRICKQLPVVMELPVPAYLSHTGQERQKCVSIDACIAPIIKALNDGGIKTTNCCCGHGGHEGWISLADGREIRIFPNLESAQ